uniref:Superoxide dismutase n=1 Tax=Rhabditophanes sp. KR3021 TaxID=114890 RepID=A0AC35TFX9_9BILA
MIIKASLSNVTATAPRSVSSLLNVRAKHVLPDLPYDYDDLEPVISTEIMKLHHQKHHNTYVNGLNEVEEKIAEANARGDLKTSIALQNNLKFHGGGHLNHSIFWTNLAKDGGEPSNELMEAVKRDFGTLENLQKTLSAKSIGVQGSGWGWLGYCQSQGILKVATCQNQDPLEPSTGLIPLFGIDVWEHAYYLQYRNVRPDYVNQIWKIANWKNISERYHNAVALEHEKKEAQKPVDEKRGKKGSIDAPVDSKETVVPGV